MVAYMNGRPTTCLRPTVLISWRSTSVDSTPPLLLTPRISAISGGGDRLLVGDHRQRLERLHRQLLRRPLVEQLAHPLVQLGARDDLVAAGDLDELQAARPLVVGAQRRERGVDVLPRLAVEQLVQRLRRHRLGRREDQRFDDRLQMVGHAVASLDLRFVAVGLGVGALPRSASSADACVSAASARADFVGRPTIVGVPLFRIAAAASARRPGRARL